MEILDKIKLILYTAIFDNEKTIRYVPEKLDCGEDRTEEFEGGAALKGVVRIVDMSSCGCKLYNNLEKGQLLVLV